MIVEMKFFADEIFCWQIFTNDDYRENAKYL